MCARITALGTTAQLLRVTTATNRAVDKLHYTLLQGIRLDLVTRFLNNNDYTH